MFESSSLMIMFMIASLMLNLITMIFVIMSYKKIKQSSNQNEPNASVSAFNSSAVSGVVFCRQCGNQYDSTLPACPSCKATR
jgi:hypothetical protein